MLTEFGAPPDHVAALESEVGAIRIRPEEVAGSATLKPQPAEFEPTKRQAEQILTILEARSTGA
jgi:hypothetical protein